MKPKTYSADLAHLPAALAPMTEQPRWVLWNWELRENNNGETKWTKPPYQPSGKAASSNNPKTWSTYRAVIAAMNGADGIGYNLLNGRISAIDLDGCRDEQSGETDSWARTYVEQASSCGAYVEISPSGTGFRIIGLSDKEVYYHKHPVTSDRDKAGVEIFRNINKGRYITVTGLMVGACDELKNIDPIIDKIIAEHGNTETRHREKEEKDHEEPCRDGADRSSAFQSIVWSLAAQERTLDEIEESLRKDSSGPASKYLTPTDRLRSEIERSYAKWQTAAGANPTSLPELIIDPGNLVGVAKQLAAMFAQHRRFLFNGHEPIQVVHETDGMPRAVPVTPEMVRVFADEICTPTKVVKKRKVRVTLSKDISNLYLHGLVGQWDLKPFNGITTAPILASDGSFRTVSGYDEATGLWCHDVPEVVVPEQPTGAQAKASLDALRQFFRTFAFADAKTMRDATLGVDVVDPEAPIGLDESCFLVALMTAVCRASLLLAPGILASAPAFSGAGTGKGLATKAICIIASGAPPSAFTAGHDAEELDKRLTAALVEARPAIFLDNYNGKNLTSDILASALTENPCEVRPMGHTAMVRLHTRTFVAMTGNAVQIAEDMVRRVICVYFDAKVENPELRPFKPGFLDTVHKERATLLGHALTIWRWGRQNASLLTQGKPLGSYEEWVQWCRDPLTNLGAKDPVDRLAAIKAADPKRKRILGVLEAWHAAHKSDLVLAKELDQTVIEVIDEKAGVRDGKFHYSRQFVAGWLQQHAGTRIAGYVLTTEPSGPKSKPVNKYKVEGPPLAPAAAANDADEVW
jgi:hypothetical protein